MAAAAFSRPSHVALAPQKHILDLVDQALETAGVAPADIDVIAYTKVSDAGQA